MQVSVFIPQAIKNRVDLMALEQERSRSFVITKLVEIGLKTIEKDKQLN